MSIIEDALGRVKKERPQGTPPLHDGEFDDISPDLDPDTATAPSHTRRNITFVVVMVLVAGALWLGLDLLQEMKLDKARNSMAALSDNPLGLGLAAQQKSNDATPQEERAENSADNEELMRRDDPFVEPTSVEQAARDEITIAVEAEPVVLAKEETPTGTTAPKMEMAPKEKPTDSLWKVPTIKLKPLFKKESAATAEEKATTNEPAPEHAPAPAVVAAPTEVAWISDGQVAFDAGDSDTALALWKEGFATQQGNDLVFIISAYSQREAALAKLKQVGGGSSAFVLDGFLNGSRGYWLLAMPSIEKRDQAQKAIAAALRLPTIKGNDLPKTRKKLARHRDKKPVAIASHPARKKTKKISSRQKRRKAFVGSLAARASADIAKAEKMVIRGSYQEAVTLLQPHFKAPFSNGKAYLVLGAAYLGLKEYDLADKYLDEGLAINGAESRLWLQKALVAQERARHKNAISYLQEAERLNPGLPEVQLGFGYSYDSLGEKGRAAGAYRNFLGLTERDKRYLTLRQSVVRRLTRLGF